MSDSRPGTPGDFADDADRYRLESRIATGGMGEVWRGTDTVLGRPVAVKLLKNEYADDPMFRTRFETEARHAAALHHPGVASVYDFGEAGTDDGSGVPRPFLVMELVDGQPLSALLRDGRPLDPEAVRDLLAQAGDAIGAAHAAGIVHRDVKPANLLVTPDRQVKITDFGIARAAEGLGVTETGQVLGTPQYLSPEQARGGSATPASDVYSLGVMGFECLTGHRPFQAQTPVATALAHLHEPVPELPAEVPADLAGVVRRAMSKDPAERFPDAAAFAAAVRDPASASPPGLGAGAVASAAAATAVVPGVAAPAAAHDATSVAAPVAAPVGAPGSGTVDAPTPAEGVSLADPDAEGRRRRWWPLLIGLAVVALLAVVVALALQGGDDDGEQPVDGPTSSPGETVRVQEDDYVGRPLAEVREELTALGLRVSPEAVANPGGREPGLVTGLDPTGRLREGATVTVTYWDEVAEAPTEEPTEGPTAEPSESPTEEPTEEPSESPSEQPTTEEPTQEPTEEPTEEPTQEPTEEPTQEPTPAPTPAPTPTPTPAPTRVPTPTPTVTPTPTPTPPASPTASPAAADAKVWPR